MQSASSFIGQPKVLIDEIKSCSVSFQDAMMTTTRHRWWSSAAGIPNAIFWITSLSKTLSNQYDKGLDWQMYLDCLLQRIPKVKLCFAFQLLIQRCFMNEGKNELKGKLKLIDEGTFCKPKFILVIIQLQSCLKIAKKSVKSEKIGFENRSKSKFFLPKFFLTSGGRFSESFIKIIQCISKIVKIIQIHRIWFEKKVRRARRPPGGKI